ncbi:AAA family ATPase [Thermomonas sp.]|uniref:AAA family ATPase n=1 Tax=Thermomonas sp. TaxID=1971895 RepID=UPI0035B0D812
MTTRLSVSDFSCIKNAEIELSDLTVLIGPSASGKSVISKLTYFFNSLLADQFYAIEDRKSLDSFKDLVKERFKEWFPVSAWGAKKFCIEFEAGSYQVRITRIEYRKKLGENIRVWFSGYFEDQFRAATELVEAAQASSDAIEGQPLEAFWKIRESVNDGLQRHLGRDFHELQTFIPAGRSFFTSVGKSIAAFEHGRILDPLTVRFGRFYAALKERGSWHYGREDSDPKWVNRLNDLMSGKLVSERSSEYLHAPDGRKIPLSALSSGQQELMPLVLAIRNRAATHMTRRFQQLIYIEEPEAHLFPSAQSALVEAFGNLLGMAKGRTRLFITTHSPYVLAKVNNLIKAKQVAGAKRSKRYAAVDNIVPDQNWIDGSKVHAYALDNGSLVRIQDLSDGLIEASYLDDVSGDIAQEFSRILSVEFAS